MKPPVGLGLVLTGLALAVAPAAPPRALPPGPPPTVRLAVIGDYGSVGAGEASVATLVAAWKPDAVLTVGDNNYPVGGGDTIDANIGQYYEDYIYPYAGSYGAGAAANQFFPALGNHDWLTAGAQPYLNYFALPGNERYYQQTVGPVQLFAIDSDPHEPDGITATSPQAQWLRAGLAASAAPWKLVYMHHPPYTSGTNHGSTAALQWPYAAWGATVVLAGHEHNYERLLQGGMLYVVNGLGGRGRHPDHAPLPGSQFFYAEQYGAMLIEASATRMTFEFVNIAGTVIDTFTLTKPWSAAQRYFVPLVLFGPN
jgi:hypothetical protein